MSARAGIVVTGTEVLAGRVRDRNGPWLADRLSELGIDLAHITICGDRPADVEAQLRFLTSEGVDLVVTSGGLGPTADDLTAEVVGRFQGRDSIVDEELERRIAAVVEPLLKRWRGLDQAAIEASARKQATIPAGADVLGPAGTAPGLVVPPADGRAGPTVLVLPGPPRELHATWHEAVASETFGAAVAGRSRYEHRMLRLIGIPESEIAETLRVGEERIDGLDTLEVTTCLRRGELEVAVRYEPPAEPAWEGLLALVRERHAPQLFSDDGTSVDEQVATLLRESGATVAVAESCTGGELAGRLSGPAGASAYFAGGIVAYADEAKTSLLDVDPALIARHGAVSPQVASAMAAGAVRRFGASAAVAVTGVAGPGGGTEEKPVGYVCFAARLADERELARDLVIPGERAEVRDRSTTLGMHVLRRLLLGAPAPT
ncbi:MAG: competence/damage-inducible protein A [Thermoleophilaceae bacterium]|nr:competence/damage-inducible protein A [Thermoleophilaceae bacterium]